MNSNRARNSGRNETISKNYKQYTKLKLMNSISIITNQFDSIRPRLNLISIFSSRTLELKSTNWRPKSQWKLKLIEEYQYTDNKLRNDTSLVAGAHRNPARGERSLVGFYGVFRRHAAILGDWEEGGEAGDVASSSGGRPTRLRWPERIDSSKTHIQL